MNSEQYLEVAAQAIHLRPNSTYERWTLRIKDGEIICVPSVKDCPKNLILGKFNSVELDAGFSKRQWAVLQGKISTARIGGFLK